MKKLLCSLALLGALAACKSQTTAVTDTSTPAPGADCSACETACAKADAASCDAAAKASCDAADAKVCPVTGTAIN